MQLEIAVRLGIPMLLYPLQLIDWQSFDGIVDGLFGTGSKGAPREPYAGLIREANASGLPIVANINAFIVYCTLLVFSNTNHFFISGHPILGTEFSYRKCSRF